MTKLKITNYFSEMTSEDKKKEANRFLQMFVGTIIYGFFMNFFIVSAGMYSGGFVGIAQILRTIINYTLNLDTGTFDYAGIIGLVMNVPLFILAHKSVGKKYLVRTAFCNALINIFMTIFPVPRTMIIDDMLASAIIGGIGCGLGGGLILRNGGSSGGMDLVGAALIHRYHNLSISAVSNSVNIVVFLVMMIMFGPELVIYSLIFSVTYPLVVDRVFAQNINVELHVIVKRDDGKMQKEVMEKMRRGITKWSVIGAYTGDEKEMLYILVNKYEMSRLIQLIKKYDKDALIVQNVGVRIQGPFEKRIE